MYCNIQTLAMDSNTKLLEYTGQLYKKWIALFGAGDKREFQTDRYTAQTCIYNKINRVTLYFDEKRIGDNDNKDEIIHLICRSSTADHLLVSFPEVKLTNLDMQKLNKCGMKWITVSHSPFEEWCSVLFTNAEPHLALQ
jgi:hypothetical protein